MPSDEEKKLVRNDGLLDTGLSSAVGRKQAQRAEEQKRAREERRAQLSQGSEIIIEWIDKEIADAADIRKLVLNIASEDNARAELLAIQKHVSFLESLKSRANNVLRQSAKADAKAQAATNKDMPKAWKD